MNVFLSDLLRSIVTNIMFMVVLLSLVEPKYNKITTWIIVFTIALANILLSVYLYLNSNYTIITKLNLAFLIVLSLGAKPFFKESFMQWLFNVFSVINLYATIVVISYVLCLYFRYSYYANIVIRLIMFVGVYFLFNRLLKPLYHKVLEHWKLYFILIFGIFINFVYYLYFNNDIKKAMSDNIVALLLIILMQIFVYISIFYSLKFNAVEFAIKEDNLSFKAQQLLLQKELIAYQDFTNISKQNIHDLRHHNAVIVSYLDAEDIKGVREYLKEYSESIDSGVPKEYCYNKVANAIFRLYDRRASRDGINFAVIADFPQDMPFSGPEIGIVISNLLENAYEACKNVEDKKIAFLCTVENGSMHIEVKNSIEKAVVFNGEFPISTKENGGIGTKSIANIVKNHGGMLRFTQTDKEFIVQIVLYLQ